MISKKTSFKHKLLEQKRSRFQITLTIRRFSLSAHMETQTGVAESRYLCSPLTH